MTTAVHEKPQVAAQYKVIFQGNINLDQIDVSAQVRKKFDAGAHKELTESVRTKGIINPITLRPGDKHGRFELVAGERRYRAAQAADLKVIPAVVRELDDQGAALYQVEENIHRKDLTPIEEARGFKLLLDAQKFTVKQLGDLVGKSESYVYRAIALLELPADVVELIEKEDLTPAHGHQFLRLPDKQRVKFMDKWFAHNGGVHPTAKELQYEIEQELGSDLTHAAFLKNKTYAGQIACTDCPSNSGNQGMLFEGAEKGRCFDASCFKKKTVQAEEDEVAAIRKKHPEAKIVQKMHGWISPGYSRAGDFVVKGPLKENKPPKGPYGLVLSSRDSELYLALPEKKSEKTKSPVGMTETKKDPKTEFINDLIATAVYDAAAAKAKGLKPTVEDWRSLADNAAEQLPNEIVASICGQSAEELDLSKLTEEKARTLVLLNQRLPYNPTDADWKKLGVDVVAVRKRAKAEAEKEWASTWGLKHKSIANSGSEVLCGIRGLNYDKPTEGGIAVATIEETTCVDCKAKEKKLRSPSR